MKKWIIVVVIFSLLIWTSAKMKNKNSAVVIGFGGDTMLGRLVNHIERNRINIGLLGYANHHKEWAATEDKPGINYVAIGDIEKIKKGG